MAAGGRRRVLPAWMEAAGDERVVAAGTPPAEGGQRRQRQAAGPRAAVYCMNEAELVDVALAVLAEFIQWNIHKSGLKVSEYDLPSEATDPFVLSGYSGYKQVQFPRGRLFAFDSEGNYMLTCSSTGGVLFKLNGEEKVLESCLSLGGHRAPVVTVDWSTAMDCGTCLTASMDGKIKLTTLLAQKS
ncbi:WD repeat-containing protein 91-like [Aquila chrysaetos chrysaetos]|uniref:WD repeat-containing protein 91-like n=1 Tax=Aquila chrysaetos chrysaetos TaxID=223781 RepID=UPI001177234C|nr:WD repeat-containing protein 91-like [Aquila chrysaetos chrysaetos]